MRKKLTMSYWSRDGSRTDGTELDTTSRVNLEVNCDYFHLIPVLSTVATTYSPHLCLTVGRHVCVPGSYAWCDHFTKRTLFSKYQGSVL